MESNCRLKRKANKKRKKRQKQEARVSLVTASKATADVQTALISDAKLW
jgi:hypothetical protein